MIAPFVASLAFAHLGYQEVRSPIGEAKKKPSQQLCSYSLALPMTLNNLAGGVAGGMAGIEGNVAFLYAFLASSIAMTSGYWIGVAFSHSSPASRQEGCSPELVAAFIYFSLSLVTVFEAIR